MESPSHPKQTALQQALWLLGLAVLYFALARIARLLTLPPHGISVFWPPNGIVLGVMLRTQRWRWRTILAGIVLGQLVLNFTDAKPLLLTAAFTTANLVEIWMGAALLQRFCGPAISLRRPSEVAYLILFPGLVACAVSGAIGIAAVKLVIPETTFLSAWAVWMVADGMSTLILTPVLLTWVPREGARPEPLGVRRAGEAILLFALLSLVAELIFGPFAASEDAGIPMLFLVFPFVLWGAVRFGPRGASATSLIVTVVAVGNASIGRGPKFFMPEKAADTALWLQVYLAAVVLSVLFLAAVWSERGDFLRSLEESQDRLARTEAFARHIVSTAPAMICGLDPDGTVVSVNPFVTRETGYAPGEIVGKSFWELFYPGELGAQVEKARAELQQEAGGSYEIDLQAKDGSRRTVVWSAASQSDPEDRPVSLILLGSDITARKQAEEALRRTLEELEARVLGRTKDLVEANQSLEVQIAERARVEEALRLAHEELEMRANEVILSQARELFELSTPIVKIGHGMELVPLIGKLDGRRAAQLTEQLLERVARDGSSLVLLDVTGVLAIEQDTAQHLMKTIAAVRLLGAQTVLTGLRPAIARTLVELGIDLAGVETQGTLAAALGARLRRKEAGGAERVRG